MMLWAAPGEAQDLTATADDVGLWVLVPDADQPDAFTVLHHALNDPPTLLNKVPTLRGDIRPDSVAARDHTLWIIYTHGEVQAIRAEASVLKDSWEYRSRVEPSLPDGVSVRATAISSAGLWTLVRVDDRQVLEKLDALGDSAHGKQDRASAKRLRNIAIGLPRNYGIDDLTEAAPSGKPTDPAEDTTPDAELVVPAEPDVVEPEPGAIAAEDDPSLPVDRLLYLQHGRWRVHALPDIWAHGAEAWLVSENKTAQYPTLVAHSTSGELTGPLGIDVYRHPQQTDDGWDTQAYTLDGSEQANGLTFMGIEDQLVSAQIWFDAGEVSADLSVLRGGRTIPVGRMSLPGVPPSQWVLIGAGNTAALLARQPAQADVEADADDALSCVWTRMDVRGSTRLEPSPLAIRTPSTMDNLAQYIMLAFIAVLVSMLMLAFWRRDASWNKLELPENLMIADLGRRAFAAAIDMAPGLAGSMIYFGLWFDEVMLRWPGNGIAHTIEQVIPGTIVIAVFVGHTTLSELIFARTLGKLVTGLRTTALDGTRPRLWQLLVRGLLKILDLIPGAWLLLMLPVIAPHRQRLGDLVGRTVVVCDAPPVEQNDADDSDSSPNE